MNDKVDNLRDEIKNTMTTHIKEHKKQMKNIKSKMTNKQEHNAVGKAAGN
jgi:hypothetical protein